MQKCSERQQASTSVNELCEVERVRGLEVGVGMFEL